ncbi:MAG: PEP-CTERM sorting domain-containing protein, partial [Gammaproteobacteria bacterium]
QAGILYFNGFESGSLGPEWSTNSSTASGRIQVTGAFGTVNGGSALLMDVSQSGSSNLNEAILTVDLSGLTNAELSFAHADFNDEETFLPSTFTGSANGDGVAISEDGVNWQTVLNAVNLAFGIWETVNIDLVAAASTAGITLGPNFQIKFQQFDNFPLTTDGRGYDDIFIRSTDVTVPEPSTFPLLGIGTLALAASGLRHRSLRRTRPTAPAKMG